jgi:hypothetical protein
MRILLLLPAGAMLLIATACGHGTQAAAAPKPLQVLVADVQQKDVPLYREWIGTVDGLVNAEIKAQVSRQVADFRSLTRLGHELVEIVGKKLRIAAGTVIENKGNST